MDVFGDAVDDWNTSGYAVRMLFWISHIRPILYAASGFFTLLLYWIAGREAETPLEALTLLIRLYGFAGITLLYFSLLPSPLYAAFPSFPLRPVYIKARQALGVSAFFFGSLHAYLVTFKVLGGLPALFATPASYFLPFMMGLAALLILAVLALTSPSRIHVALGARWKPLHRLVYVAGVLLFLHAIVLGTHFGNLKNPVALIFLAAVLILFLLEALRFAGFLSRKFPSLSPIAARVISCMGFSLLFVGILIVRLYSRPF